MSGGGGPTTATADALPARIRRMTRAEYDNSVRELLGTTTTPSVDLSFPPDAKQGPTNSPAGAAFTVNDAQRVDPVLAVKLDTAALALVAEARKNGKLDGLAHCSDTSAAGGEGCANTFIQSFASKAFHRPPTAEETAGLLKAYHVGADGYSYADGIDLVTRVVLQSPGFLYLTELGEVGASGSFAMTANEIATSLSYLLTSKPPDTTLSSAASSLSDPEQRAAQAKRLIESADGRERFVRVVREWLGIDDVAKREKSQSVYPDFANLSRAMEQESHDFIDEVLTKSDGNLADLLTANWTIAQGPLATMYGATQGSDGHASLANAKRLGILNQGAFLSVFATNSGSHPVFRGVAIMRRIACVAVPDPSSAGIVVSFPATDPSKSTRQRFAEHSKDATCATCHKTIDSFGFAFEGFDGMGKARSKDNNVDIDTQVTISTGTDLDGTYADSADLVTALSKSQQVKSCLARQIFRSTAARSDESMKLAEDAFVETWKGLPAEQQGRLKDVLLAFVKSPLFIQRRTP